MNTEKPMCSVLMAAHNAEKYIAIAIASILQQTYLNWELIVVDDGSDDWTWSIIQLGRDKRIKSLRTMVNKGKYHAMELALKQARGVYILEVDADDWLEPDSLEQLVIKMNSMPSQVGMIYGDRHIYDDVKGRPYFRYLYKGPHIADKYALLLKFRAVGPRFYKKQALIDAGGWQKQAWGDNRLYEDFCLTLRILERYEIRNVGYTGYNIRKHHTNITRNNRHRWWPTMKKIALYYMSKWDEGHIIRFDDRRRKAHIYKNRPGKNNQPG